jgi:hypothetical protein
MGGAVGAEQARLGQSPGIAPVSLHRAGARRIHGREVRVRDDDLVAEGLETAGHPFAVSRGLDQHPGPGPGSQHGGEARGLGADPLLEDQSLTMDPASDARRTSIVTALRQRANLLRDGEGPNEAVALEREAAALTAGRH